MYFFTVAGHAAHDCNTSSAGLIGFWKQQKNEERKRSETPKKTWVWCSEDQGGSIQALASLPWFGVRMPFLLIDHTFDFPPSPPMFGFKKI